MNSKEKDAWLAALRSGEYQQETGYLHRDGGYCCLGVLLKTLGITEEQMGGAGSFSQVDVGMQANLDLPEELRQRLLGLLTYEQSTQLSGLNDSLHWDFNMIADWIEEKIKVQNETYNTDK